MNIKINMESDGDLCLKEDDIYEECVSKAQKVFQYKEEDHFHIHEVLDRLHVITCNLDDYILAHPSIESRPKLYKKIEKITMDLAKIYQEVGNITIKEKK